MLALLIPLLGLPSALAQNENTIDMAVGWHKPPYVIAENNSGFELELIQSVFQTMAYTTKVVYVPYGRSHNLLKRGLVDIALTANSPTGIAQPHISEVYVVYQNVALSLKNSKLEIQSMEDLAKYSVVSFQNATTNLGGEYADAVKQSPMYLELPEQRRQVELLLLGNVQVAVMDINIFNYLSKEISGSNQLINTEVHKLFAPTPYRVGFKDQNLKDRFNLALSRYLGSEAYPALLKKYDFYYSHRLPRPLPVTSIKRR